jgi:hypothetical protein
MGRFRLRPLTVVLMLVLGGAVFLLKQAYWPTGSKNMLVASDGTAVEAVFVCSSAEVLWRIVAVPRGVPGLERVPYGTVPDGFAQHTPSWGSPRPFRDGEQLEVHVLTASHDMAEGGRATGPGEFLSIIWFDGPRAGPATEARCARR